MRVFRNYRAVLHKNIIPYKELFGMITQTLSEFQLSYRKAYFEFEFLADQIPRFLEKNPEWKHFHAIIE
jgi:hypothetical protein